MTSNLARWLSNPANATFALAWLGILFTVCFWAITGRLEPSFVALFGTLLTTSALLTGRSQPGPPDQPPTAPPLTEGDE